MMTVAYRVGVETRTGDVSSERGLNVTWSGLLIMIDERRRCLQRREVTFTQDLSAEL